MVRGLLLTRLSRFEIVHVHGAIQKRLRARNRYANQSAGDLLYGERASRERALRICGGIRQPHVVFRAIALPTRGCRKRRTGKPGVRAAGPMR
jgi:hypothetical protein